MNNKTKKTVFLAVTTIPLVFLLLLALWAYGRMEAYCFFNPDIDTEYATGFSEDTFGMAEIGISAVCG